MFETKVVEKIETHLFFQELFLTENRTLYNIYERNVVQPDRPQMTTYYDAEEIRIACQTTKAKIKAHKYLILIRYYNPHTKGPDSIQHIK